MLADKTLFSTSVQMQKSHLFCYLYQQFGIFASLLFPFPREEVMWQLAFGCLFTFWQKFCTKFNENFRNVDNGPKNRHNIDDVSDPERNFNLWSSKSHSQGILTIKQSTTLCKPVTLLPKFVYQKIIPHLKIYIYSWPIHIQVHGQKYKNEMTLTGEHRKQ